MENEIFFFASLVLLSVLLYLQHKKSSEQISELIKAVIAKNPQEFIEMKQNDKKIVEKPVIDNEIPLSSLDDKSWMKAIEKT
jgi:hypothetical protein